MTIPEKPDSQTSALQQEIGIAVKTYLATAGLKDSWFCVEVGIIGEGRVMHWAPFAKNEADWLKARELADLSRGLPMSLAKISKKIFTTAKEGEERQPYLAVEDTALNSPGFQIIDMPKALGLLKWTRDIKADCETYKSTLGLEGSFKYKPFLIPLVQMHNSQPNLAGALVIYLLPIADVLRHLPIIKTIALPLLEIRRHKYGLPPSAQKELELLVFQYLMAFPPGLPPFGKSIQLLKADVEFNPHIIDFRLLCHEIKAGIDSCPACFAIESKILICEKKCASTFIEGILPCDDCGSRYLEFFKCSKACWTTKKSLFCLSSSSSRISGKLKLRALAEFLDVKNHPDADKEIVLPAQPGILVFLSLGRIYEAVDRPSVKIERQGDCGVRIEFPLDHTKVQGGTPTGLRDKFYEIGWDGARRVGGSTSNKLWKAIFMDFSALNARVVPDDYKDANGYVNNVLGPRGWASFCVNFERNALVVWWLGERSV